MKTILTLFFALIVTITSRGQQNFLGVPQNSATTQGKIDLAKNNINQAYLAYSEGNLEKCKYFVDQSQEHGFKSGDFYFLLGTYMYYTKEFKAAKRYWTIAHKEGGCWDCKELIEKLKNEQPLDDLVKKKVDLYIVQLKK